VRELFVDTNVVLDLLMGKEPHASLANKFFAYAVQNDIGLNVCSLSYGTLYYLVKKKMSHQSAIDDLIWIFKLTESVHVDKNIIKQSLESRFRDFEDAIQYYCALQVSNCEAIISRNEKDFRLSTLPVCSPEFFLAQENI